MAVGVGGRMRVGLAVGMMSAADPKHSAHRSGVGRIGVADVEAAAVAQVREARVANRLRVIKESGVGRGSVKLA